MSMKYVSVNVCAVFEVVNKNELLCHVHLVLYFCVYIYLLDSKSPIISYNLVS